jgi:hypothetical protein
MSPAGSWQARPVRTSRFFTSSKLFSQRGSVTQSTITLALALVVLVGLASLGFFYLSQVFGTAAHGTDVQALETKLDDLKQQQLQLQGAESRSIQAVEDRVKKLNLVTTDKVSYLTPQTDRVAMVVGGR